MDFTKELLVAISGLVAGLTTMFILLQKKGQQLEQEQKKSTNSLLKNKEDVEKYKAKLGEEYNRRLRDKLEEIEKRHAEKSEEVSDALFRISELFSKALDLFTKQSISLERLIACNRCSEEEPIKHKKKEVK